MNQNKYKMNQWQSKHDIQNKIYQTRQINMKNNKSKSKKGQKLLKNKSLMKIFMNNNMKKKQKKNQIKNKLKLQKLK